MTATCGGMVRLPHRLFCSLMVPVRSRSGSSDRA